MGHPHQIPKTQPDPNPVDRSVVTYQVPRKPGPPGTRTSLPKIRRVTVKPGRGR